MFLKATHITLVPQALIFISAASKSNTLVQAERVVCNFPLSWLTLVQLAVSCGTGYEVKLFQSTLP